MCDIEDDCIKAPRQQDTVFQNNRHTFMSQHHVVLCFFGLVKNITQLQIESIVRNVIMPLSETGVISISGLLHTHRVEVTTNPRNKELNVGVDQAESIKQLSSIIRFVDVRISEVEDSEKRTGNIECYLMHGDPWPDNPRVSLTMYLRLMDSLYNMHDMIRENVRLKTINPDSIFVMLRPDVLFLTRIDVLLIERALAELAEGKHNTAAELSKWIILPSWNRFRGENDRFAIGGLNTILSYCSRLDDLMNYVKDKRKTPHAETYLGYYVKSKALKVIRTDFKFCRVRADGRYDSSECNKS